MGTLSTEAQKVVFDVKSTLSNFASNATNVFDGAVGMAQAKAGGILNGDVVGITVDAAQNINAAITQYVSDLEAHLNEVKTNADTSEAFAGTYAGAVKEFVDAVVDSCYAIISNLNAFKEKMDAVATAYATKDTDLASEIKSQGAEVKSQFKAYDGSK